jgi:hypothetical protein
MASEFTFVGENERLEVRVIGFEHSFPERQNAENWLNSTISVNVGAFTGLFKTAFTSDDLVMLDEQLRNALSSKSGPVSFRNRGGDLSLCIEFSHPEHLILSGVIQPHCLPHGVLHFRLDTSKAALNRTLRGLEDALRKFGPGILQSRAAWA